MLNWILNQFKRQSAEDLERAREMVKAAENGRSRVDASKARDLARALGVEVDINASTDQVIQAIRRYLTRHGEL
jgi:transcriptional regulator with XRE-family HTH domain